MNKEYKDLGKIVSIEEVENIKSGDYNYDGYKVITSKTVICILIDNYQNCCENWGYLHTEDNINDFINAEIKEITLTDTAFKTIKKLEYYEEYKDYGDIQFVTFETNKGTFQLAVYNQHNGYYGHSILISIGDNVIVTYTI